MESISFSELMRIPGVPFYVGLMIASGIILGFLLYNRLRDVWRAVLYTVVLFGHFLWISLTAATSESGIQHIIQPWMMPVMILFLSSLFGGVYLKIKVASPISSMVGINQMAKDVISRTQEKTQPIERNMQ